LIRDIEYYEYWDEISYDKHIQIDYPFIKKRYPIKNISYGGNSKIPETSNFESHQKPLLTSFEFESIADIKYVNAMNLYKLAMKIQELQDEIMQLIKIELEK
jgi:hypothetical protein